MLRQSMALAALIACTILLTSSRSIPFQPSALLRTTAIQSRTLSSKPSSHYPVHFTSMTGARRSSPPRGPRRGRRIRDQNDEDHLSYDEPRARRDLIRQEFRDRDPYDRYPDGRDLIRDSRRHGDISFRRCDERAPQGRRDREPASYYYQGGRDDADEQDDYDDFSRHEPPYDNRGPPSHSSQPRACTKKRSASPTMLIRGQAKKAKESTLEAFQGDNSMPTNAVENPASHPATKTSLPEIAAFPSADSVDTSARFALQAGVPVKVDPDATPLPRKLTTGGRLPMTNHCAPAAPPEATWKEDYSITRDEAELRLIERKVIAFESHEQNFTKVLRLFVETHNPNFDPRKLDHMIENYEDDTAKMTQMWHDAIAAQKALTRKSVKFGRDVLSKI